ncbi:MAG TPA: signal peptide peptidase SppA [Candidatus Deferrimicrobium sp.]|nr:signal peptide peptidase SppA [Candidatus Deferrimicrobium sp.]
MRSLTKGIFVMTIGLGAAGPLMAERLPMPDGVFYYKPAASVFGAEAAWTNPAALSRYRTSSVQVISDIEAGSTFKSWGAVINREQIGAAYRVLRDSLGQHYREVLLASSVALGQIHVGGSYRHFKEAPGVYHKKHFWNLGVVGSSGRFSWAAVWSNLNRSRLGGERTETEQRYSLSFRPAGNTLTLSVDMFFSTKTRLDNADYVYHVEAVPKAGLYVEGFITSDKEFQVGLRANLQQYFTGVQSFFTSKGRHTRTTAYLGATNSRQASLIPPSRHRLTLDVGGRLRENPPQPVFGRRETSFIALLLTIHRAADDPSIAQMLLRLDSPRLGLAQAQELREALLRFRERGKTIVCHATAPNNIGYFIASATDSILIPPVSQLNLVGLRAELSFYAGTLEKLGAKADLMRIGAYKSAAEMYTEKVATEENRAQINRLLDDLYDQFVTAIADGRQISADSVRKIIDGGPYTSEEARRFGLVDGLSYRDELDRSVISDLPEISFRQYQKDTLLNDGWPAVPKIAVVVAEGDIAGNTASVFGGGDDVTPAVMERAFTVARRAPDVRGIVFRINSPGGLALAGEEIYRSVRRAGEEKPIVVSMANVAASGGYYVAMPCRKLFSNPATITGSVGIYGGKIDMSGLYEKIALTKELFTRGRFAGMLSTIRPFTDDERAKYFSHMQAFYDHFIQLVAENRGLKTDSVRALSEGRVWTGREALSHGLIDELGGLKQSIDEIADRSGLKDYRIAVFPERRPWFVFPGRSLMNAAASLFSDEKSPAQQWAEGFGLGTDGEILARLPFDISIE